MDPLGIERAMTIISLLNGQFADETIIKKVRGCTSNILGVIRKYGADLDKNTKLARVAQLKPYAPMNILIEIMQGKQAPV